MRHTVRKEQSQYMRARQLQNKARCQNSKAENWMEEKLANTGKKWTRQAMWGCRLFDFWCHEIGCAVEVDGPEHNAKFDAARDQYNYFRSAIVVLRVRNFNEADADEAIKQIGRLASWRDRRNFIGASAALVAKMGLKLANGNWAPPR